MRIITAGFGIKVGSTVLALGGSPARSFHVVSGHISSQRTSATRAAAAVTGAFHGSSPWGGRSRARTSGPEAYRTGGRGAGAGRWVGEGRGRTRWLDSRWMGPRFASLISACAKGLGRWFEEIGSSTCRNCNVPGHCGSSMCRNCRVSGHGAVGVYFKTVRGMTGSPQCIL